MESPFRISGADNTKRGSDESFQPSRTRLCTGTQSRFCLFHEATITTSEKQVYLLHGDVLYALFMPLLQLFREASLIAALVLPHQSHPDLELAFRGEARGAYTWLQCIVAEERDWCLAKGCPACVVLHVFQSEPLVRLIVIACRLPEYMNAAGLGQSRYNLPSCRGFLDNLKRAVERDPFWDEGFWQRVEQRASLLEQGIRQLIAQYLLLLHGLSAQGKISGSIPSSSGVESSSSLRSRSETVPVRLSAIALRQAEMKWEELVALSKLVKERSPFHGRNAMFS